MTADMRARVWRQYRPDTDRFVWRFTVPFPGEAPLHGWRPTHAAAFARACRVLRLRHAETLLAAQDEAAGMP